jgi:hypothetical protein
MKKKCPNCKLEKDLSEFSKDNHKKSGRCSWCKECIKIKKLKNHETEKIYRDKYYQDNKGRLLLWQKERNLAKPETTKRESARNSMLKYYYGITQEDYNRMFEEQNGCCAICGKHQSDENKALSVDHDHTTGKIRGLLCPRCNHGLGLFLDSSELLKLAANYIER